MSRLNKTIDRVLRGNADANIRFVDLCLVLSHFEFEERIRGDHHIFTHDAVREILNLQPNGNKAKAYQVRQVRTVLISYGFADEDEEDFDAEESIPKKG